METENGRWLKIVQQREPGHEHQAGDPLHYDEPHTCALPNDVGDADSGSVWYCERCTRRYRLNRNAFGISWMNA